MSKRKPKMNKFITGIATASLVATAVVPVASAASYTDIGQVSSSVQAEIHQAAALGFFNDGTHFNPSGKITRGQAALTLARYLAGNSTVKDFAIANSLEGSVTPFTDIPTSFKTGAAFQQELFYASLIVKNEGAFTQANLNPAGNVTRSQMAKIITETFGLTIQTGHQSTITDIGSLDMATKGYIETISSQGITNVTAFMPAGHVTRSQMASFLVRSYNVAHATVEINSMNLVTGNDKVTTLTANVMYADSNSTAVLTITPDASLSLADIVISNVAIGQGGQLQAALGVLPSGTHSVKVTVEGVNESATFTVDHTAADAAVAAVNAATTQVPLWTALQNPLFGGVAVQANLVTYLSDLANNYTTVAEIIEAVNMINDSIALELLFDGVETDLNAAHPNQLTINGVLNANFAGVDVTNIAAYVTAIYTGNTVSLTTMASIQQAIHLVNATAATTNTTVASTALDATGNATQAQIDAAQMKHDLAFDMVSNLNPANPGLVSSLGAAQILINASQMALDSMNDAIADGEAAKLAHIAAGGLATDAEYVTLKNELTNTTKNEAAIVLATVALDTKTDDLTATADAQAALVAHTNAGGLATDAEYVAVNNLLTTPTTTLALVNATIALEAATTKLVVYAGVMAATTPAQMRALLFEFGNANYLNLTAAQKTEFAGWFITELAAETTPPVNYAAVSVLLGSKLTAYNLLISDVNAATTNTAMVPKLTALGHAPFDALPMSQKYDAAAAVINGKPYTTIASIIAAMGL
ncbi:S-layer homology domain-containing protein [Sporosarcina sp. CAU 1771]